MVSTSIIQNSFIVLIINGPYEFQGAVCFHDACSISVTFVSEKDGSETTVKAPIGQHLLEVAHKNDIELEGRFVVCTLAQTA